MPRPSTAARQPCLALGAFGAGALTGSLLYAWPGRHQRVAASPGDADGHPGVAVIPITRTPVLVHVALRPGSGQALVRVTMTRKKQVDVVEYQGWPDG